jgi:hypothetical protein
VGSDGRQRIVVGSGPELTKTPDIREKRKERRLVVLFELDYPVIYIGFASHVSVRLFLGIHFLAAVIYFWLDTSLLLLLGRVSDAAQRLLLPGTACQGASLE